MEAFWRTVADQISRSTGKQFAPETVCPVGGGCISSGYRLQGDSESYFVKTNVVDALPIFAAEYAGLLELASPGVIVVPDPVCYGTCETRAFLVMAQIDIGRSSARGQGLLGECLARLHQSVKPQYGWDQDNFIGSTLQPNQWQTDWIQFVRDQRVGYQLGLAAQNGYGGRLQSRGEILLDRMQSLFHGYQVKASLLHGDLWAGNYAIDPDGQPVVFDPAVYYGDRETDIAMTELFGGFSSEFYDSYNGVTALDGGYPVRRLLYQLYHVLNHANLFGGGYPLQAEQLIDRLLAETG